VLDDAEVERALVVVAHPDDVDFGLAGTVAQWTAAGIAVTYCVITDGAAGGFDPSLPRERIAEVRKAEQQAAAAEVGVSDVRFLDYLDGQLTVTYELRADLSRVIRSVRPRRLACQSPHRTFDRIGINHPDHIAAGEAALQAVYPDARNPFAHPQLLADGLEPWVVEEVWVSASERPNHWVDVTDTFAAKLAAIKRHASQLPDPGRVEGWLRPRLAAQAHAAGLGEDRLAEAFHVMPTS
jgi:LmbE family N-acetylglucosaminyl deacetylase